MASASTIECLLREQNEALTDFFAGGGGGGAATPGGAVNSVQFNSAGALGGFGTWAGGVLTVPGSAVVNAASGFTGNLIDVQVAGASKFSIDTSPGPNYTALHLDRANVSAISSFNVGGSQAFYFAGGSGYGGSQPINITAGGGLHLTTDAQRFSWGTAIDLWLGRLGPASLRLGNVPSAAPLSQTLAIGESGLGVDIPGANGTIQSGSGTGAGTQSSLFFKTPNWTPPGSTAQPQTTRMSISEYWVSIWNNGLLLNTNSIVTWGTGASSIANSADGVLRISNFAATDFGRLQFGGTTASFPALRRDATTLTVVVADNSNFAPLRARTISVDSEIILYAAATPASATATGIQGTIRWDAGFIYVCTAPNVWKRAALSTW